MCALFSPVRFGKYLLMDKLATGGMAQLYKGKMEGVEGFEKLVAIKQILPHLAEEKELVTSFIDEAKLAAMLHHQNIVQIYDFGNMEGTYYIAMEYLQGKDLRMIISRAKEKNKPLRFELILFIMSHICSGLDYAHKMKDLQGRPLNIIHRDISPQNVIITYEGEVKILDFGIAKAATQSTMTQTGMIKGKVAYMSPEQAGGKTIDYRSDIFSTGILFYELITGRRMFAGDTLQILSKVRDVAFDHAEEIMNNLPLGIYKILNLALAKEPDLRYQSCGEMLADIEAFMFGPENSNYNLKLREGSTVNQGGFLMPTASGLAQYMKELFEKEMETDMQVFRNTGEISIAGETVYETVHEPIHEPVHEKDTRSEAKVEAKPAGAKPFETKPVEVKPAEPKLVEAKHIEEKPVEYKPAEAKPQERVVTQPGVEAPEKQKKKIPLVYAVIAAAAGIIILVIVLRPWKTPVSIPDKARPNKTIQMPAAKKPPSPDPYAKAKVLLEKALGLMETKPQEAKSMLIEVVKIDTKSVQGHFRLGMVYMKLKDYKNAIEMLKKASELDPQFPDAYFNLGYVYAINKKYPKAEEMYEQVVKLSPLYLDEALFNLGIVQAKQGKKKQGAENIERAIKVNPKNEVAKEYLQKMRKKS